MNNKGFSLVELMVVVAILGILATASYPAYKDYMIRGRVGAAVPVAEKFIDEAIMYYEENEVFPTMEDLGYPLDVNEYTLANPADYIPYSFRIAMFSECDGQKANVSIRFDTAALGITGNMNMMYRIRPPGSAGENIYEVDCFYHELDSVHTEENTKYIPANCQKEWVYGCF